MDTNSTSSNNQQQSSKSTTVKKRKHKLEIQVYEADWENADSNNGQPTWKVVRSDPILDGGRPNIIEVADKAEFDAIQKQYAMCDQKIKVIREIDPFVDENYNTEKPSSIPKNNQAIPIQQNNVSQINNAYNEDAIAKIEAQKPSSNCVSQSIKESNAIDKCADSSMKKKVKVVTIGDIEVKYDGDKVYQKQWMKLTPTEASNFRIVNDSNNKIVNMNGKHIEAKRWIVVEDHKEDNIDNAVESILNS